MQFPALLIPGVLHTAGASLSLLAWMHFPQSVVAVVGLTPLCQQSCASLELQIVSKVAASVCVPSSDRGKWSWL